jgi:hypothetical protein
MQLLHDTAILPFHCFSRSSVVIRSPSQHMKTEITAVYCYIFTITIVVFPPGEYFPSYFYYLHYFAYTVFPFTFIFPRFLISHFFMSKHRFYIFDFCHPAKYTRCKELEGKCMADFNSHCNPFHVRLMLNLGHMLKLKCSHST